MIYQESSLTSAEDLFLPIHSQELHRVLLTPLGSIERNSILYASGTAQTLLHISPYILLSVNPCDKCAHAFISTPTSQVLCGAREIRTLDPCLARAVLSQLSYDPIRYRFKLDITQNHIHILYSIQNESYNLLLSWRYLPNM